MFIVAVLGLLWGSFTNVLIARVPQGMKWANDTSRCPRCGADIKWYDNVPLVSYVVLRGRCRSCKERISLRYPLVEALVAALWVAVYLMWGISVTSLVFAYLAVISVALVFIDLDVRRLPFSIVLPSYGVVAVLLAIALLLGEGGAWWMPLAGMGVLGGFYGLLWVVYPAGMGLGDVVAAGLLGLAAGFLGWPVLAVAAIAGPLLGGIVVAVGVLSGRLGRKTAVPYGPMLITGAWIGFLAGEAISNAYLGMLGVV
ncbi:prepilin peptidase [Demequina capsici]|uniref:Prepilin peptidase n=1 Tax=Demequina capsici TaxID=3075620 RepID=A0AA96FF87_9MICO|nr:prepilin peptidase [Demequina sp. PMTSA13]WNM28838.1 prepilin peptidase [Demequina sp. PMTSA13]